MGGVQEQAPFVPARLGGLWPVRHQRFSFLLVQTETRGFQETFVGWGERGMVQGLAGPALKQGDPYLGQADAQTRAAPSQGEASAPATCTQH